ncbi:hypothetical protein A3J90_08545 [candidate division WOR-1 bacterium RIFOXYC2_FULL_37_10]|uniref:Phosphodiester glycosidase domain-containing protein n=1 Tax=candidate division WOR-1 bacterium RIFOXYB2_FULL_37_13 TaxID=1802579 RepID=A0A1F4SML1_UNCSA|nr:MAG: hypothetical protein A2246_01640 [candidate division WOR-1 bacterium RIFOXYA2_FULL_37_7]OGC21597.1 MAG: hypothetical protein A2310_02225 [candidate division WOR-1 bacterium RIFOXYB2_FULL_37_13]OGC33025.1 MAG: hypothetical protein A3J90_08545 [candidate division WOR-1 bacterium RIFOXYC2_FULL_37_10]
MCFSFTLKATADAPVLSSKQLTYETSAILHNIRLSEPDRLKIALDFDGTAYYNVESLENEIDIYLFNVKNGENIQNSFDINDFTVKQIEITSYESGLLLRVPLKHGLAYKIFSLSLPDRLIIDFERTIIQVKNNEQICEGLDYYDITKAVDDKLVLAQVLEVDPKKIDVFPAIGEPEGAFIYSVLKFFNPWTKEKQSGFYPATTSRIALQNNAIAGINGTYFLKSGLPLGILMINKNVISCPIFDRTALILTSDHRAYIDNVALDAYFEINATKYPIMGINEKKAPKKDIVLYTPYYGVVTDTEPDDFNIIVVNDVVVSFECGNSLIPSNGYVLSAGMELSELLFLNAKKEDKVKVAVNVVPFLNVSATTESFLHLIGGGPRLIKNGEIYITKQEENFRADVARGRAARTIVGIKNDGALLFVTVDGKLKRKKREKERGEGHSIGMSLTEAAYFLKALGAVSALNLDGGGSSTMVVRGKIKNTPSGGAQRKISNAILFEPQSRR